MPREFLPALRGLLGVRPEALTELPEVKSAGPIGGTYTSVTYAGTTNAWGTEGRADGWDMDRVVSEGYEKTIWVFKSVEAISKHASSLPIEIGRGGDERRFAETLTDHPLLRLLNGRANPLETGETFRKRLSAQVLLSKKGAFVEVTRSRMGTMTRLDLLPPNRVQPIPDPRGDYISHYEFTTLDGRIRELDPERVRWVRDPHPTDPFSGVTPLEAAGISVDLDLKARLYNVNFIDNDARPGGVMGIDVDQLDSREIDRIQRRLGPGAQHAGEMTVVGTGPGGITYVDTSAKPRDMAYETTSQTSKGEILAAFGVPESIVGNASERTYANADREEWNFWAHTELPHLRLLSGAFSIDVEDGWQTRYNTTTVEALEFPRRLRRQEAREEWNAGLITADEYRELAGRTIFDVAQTRALWISPAKAPVPARPEDAAVLGITSQDGAASTDGQAAQPQPSADAAAAQAVADARQAEAGNPPATAAESVAQARPPQGNADPGESAGQAVTDARGAQTQALPDYAAEDVAAARTGQTEALPGLAADDVAAARTLESKTLPNGNSTGYEVADGDFDTVHSAVTAALSALFARHEGIISARLRAPKVRKGTRFWAPSGPDDQRSGDEPLNGARVVSAQRWADEAEETLSPILNRAAAATATSTTQALTGVGTVPPAVAAAALLSAAAAGEATFRFLHALAADLMLVQADATGIDDLTARARVFYDAHAPATVSRIAEAAATATVNGACESAAASIGPGIVRTWTTRLDDRVRPEHRAEQGVTLPVAVPFTVGGFAMRYPADPLAPADLTINCRCRLRYQALTDGETL
ncbi:phage portal protein [Streptomyces sp. SID13666]|uniref:phage portal protein n=1 Tax=Streptomyces sp. SID13666 TaxID=2706054 RepID=UPI0013BFA196|nr:phage portal protein [Streptomyces sp. SID13666]NEA53577.1 phage portal protein [Streptomyces sp. SID13666]